MITPDLIKFLKEQIPNRHPKLTETDREIWFHAGQYSVIEMLERKLEEITEEALSKSTVIRS